MGHGVDPERRRPQLGALPLWPLGLDAPLGLDLGGRCAFSFAPFHYGRWVIWGGRWCWVPGGYVHRPVYAPALVGWVGTGGVSVSITLGSRAAPPRVGFGTRWPRVRSMCRPTATRPLPDTA